METYNTYQEAKIANPEYAIFEYLGNFGTNKDIIDTFDIHSVAMKECDPSDYCMAAEQFLQDGRKFVDGDFILNRKGNIKKAGDDFSVSFLNSQHPANGNYFVLRAKALEEPKQVEWKNGDECCHEDYDGCDLVFIGMSIIEPTSKCHVEHFDGEYVNSYYLPVDELSKPETPEQKEKRERLEAAYVLYCRYHSANDLSCMSFDEFKSNKGIERRRGFLAIVDETNYRK